MIDTHYEKELIINGRELRYSGILKPDEVFVVINRALEEKAYIKKEKKTEEIVTPEGRTFILELRPYKEKTKYIALMIKIKVNLNNVIESTEVVHGIRRKFQKGDLLIVFDAWKLTDNESRWGLKPFVYFMKGFINKFIYTFPLESEVTGELVGDTAYIYAQIKKLLRSYGDEPEKAIGEEEVRRSIEKEIKKEKEEIKKEKKSRQK